MSNSEFRRYLRHPDDPRIKGISDHNAYTWAEQALSTPRGKKLFSKWRELYLTSEYEGVRIEGKLETSHFNLVDEGAPIKEMVESANKLINSLDSREKEKIQFNLESRERRAWMNPEVYMNQYGLRLEELPKSKRHSILEVIRATLSPSGFDRVRKLMKINHFLGHLVQGQGVMNEFSYNFLIFGSPSLTTPWGWSFYGHHLCLNVLAIGPQIVISPIFMGAEPNCIDEGELSGTIVFENEEKIALELIQSFSEELLKEAQLVVPE